MKIFGMIVLVFAVLFLLIFVVSQDAAQNRLEIQGKEQQAQIDSMHIKMVMMEIRIMRLQQANILMMERMTSPPDDFIKPKSKQAIPL